MIFGTGIDLIEVERVMRKIEDEAFKKRVFSPIEIAYCEEKINKGECFAARFAAKEAFLKAIGLGWQGKFSFSDIEILNDKNGRPYINLLGQAAVDLYDQQFDKIHVSLTHLKSIAAATVILEK